MIPSASLRLTMSQQYAKIGIDITRGQMEIRQPRAQQDIRQVPSRIEIDQGPGELHVDSTEARAALGFKSARRMTADIAGQAKQVAMEAVARISREGDQLMKIKGASIADIYLQRQNRGPMPISDVAPASIKNVEVNYTPYPTRIQWSGGYAEINTTPQAPEINFTPGSVQAYVAQKNNLQIDLVGQYMNRTF